MTELSTQTPAEIDEQIATLTLKLDAAYRTLNWLDSPQASRTFRREERVAEQLAKIEELSIELRPLQNEYIRRGRWERAFLVTSSDGHVHSTMGCSTCHRDTVFGWMTVLSGKTHAEIIEAIGENACTVCYPDAPVAQLSTAERKSRARAAVEERKAEREAAKVARELAKVPRAHALAVKVDELVEAFGLDDERREAYAATYTDGSRFAKGYDTAYSVYSDMIYRRRTRRAA